MIGTLFMPCKTLRSRQCQVSYIQPLLRMVIELQNKLATYHPHHIQVVKFLFEI